MPYATRTASIQGIEAVSVSVQIDSSPGIHAFSIVGLPDKAVQESQDRVDAAVRNSGYRPPRSQNRKYTVNLAPADLKKEGVAYDLPVAIAYLLESRQLQASCERTLLYSGVSLDGSLAPVNGTISAALLAQEEAFDEIIVPSESAHEAACIDGIRVVGARTLGEVVGHLSGTARLSAVSRENHEQPAPDDSFAYIEGQETAKRALTIAAAGNHNVLLKGPPGTGKTLLARSVASILPRLAEREMLEIAKIYSSVGLLRHSPNVLLRPFRNPHHTASPVAIIGGGTMPRPGEVSLAHRGVLFLDEFAEFPRNVLEALRQPLEDGIVTISRAAGTLSLPAQFLLIASMNPCPCGSHGDPNLTCTCAPQQIVRYRKKLSGPLLDRMDIQVTVPREQVRTAERPNSDLGTIRTAIEQARNAQRVRLAPYGMVTNAEITHRNIEHVCQVRPSAAVLLKAAVNAHHLSFRTYHRSLKVARTIADLEGADDVLDRHIAEAIALRIDTVLST